MNSILSDVPINSKAMTVDTLVSSPNVVTDTNEDEVVIEDQASILV